MADFNLPKDLYLYKKYSKFIYKLVFFLRCVLKSPQKE